MALSTVIETHLSPEISQSRGGVDFPYFTRGSRWETLDTAGWDDWVAGFRPGTLWLAAATDERYESPAQSHTERINLDLCGNFNIGFRHQYSWVSHFEYTGSDRAKRRATRAVDRLLDCFHPATGMIGHRHCDSVLVSATDAMMNLPLLMWSYYRDHRPIRCRWVIEQTVEQAREYFIRENGSVHHLLKFDGRTGELLSVQSPQGYPNGCWSRGLAWMVAGLALAGVAFQRTDWLAESRGLLAYHWKQSDQPIPPYDYVATEYSENVPPDTSAGAILASAQLLIGQSEDEPALRRLGRSILNKLFDQYRRDPADDGMIGGSSFHVPADTGVDEATVWGDFYTLESLYLSEKQTLPPHLNWLEAA